VVGLNDDVDDKNKFRVNLLGEYNIGGDAFVIEKYFEQMGITLVSTYSGNSSIHQFENSHTADLNMVMCHRSINYIAEMMEKKYGIPWIKVNFIGAEATAKSLRKIAEYFEDGGLIARAEEIIARELEEVHEVANDVKSRCEGKLAMMFVGGSRAHHYQELFSEIGMETVSAGYEFAHRDDYEGRRVLGSIKVDADSRNIEELTVTKDETRFRQELADKKVALLKKGYAFEDYDGMMPEMKKNSLVIDDISHWEAEKLIEFYKPAIFCAGIKEKYVIQKFGLPLKQLHSYDYGGPYAGFAGAINFYQEIDRMVNTSIWKLIAPPWKDQPEIVAKMADVEYVS
jgi:nitrogenase molybdenum-iron protein alpha chain